MDRKRLEDDEDRLEEECIFDFINVSFTFSLASNLQIVSNGKYRMFHLKRDPNYNNKISLVTSIFLLLDKGGFFFTFYFLRRTTEQFYGRCPPPSQRHTSCVSKFCYQSVYCCPTRYFLVGIRIAKCFTNSSIRFRCEVMFENEHTF
jgi:hypothetical protein